MVIKTGSTLDYLKAFSRYNEDYKILNDAYLSKYNNISVGNVVNCFYSRGRACQLEFNQGRS